MAEKPRHQINFRERRLASGRTQLEVAKALGVGVNTVSYWDGGRQPKIEYLPDIAELFGCTIEELFGLPSPCDKK
jgi:transcriptional regulator with XRE-family HTH domain